MKKILLLLLIFCSGLFAETNLDNLKIASFEVKDFSRKLYRVSISNYRKDQTKYIATRNTVNDKTQIDLKLKIEIHSGDNIYKTQFVEGSFVVRTEPPRVNFEVYSLDIIPEGDYSVVLLSESSEKITSTSYTIPKMTATEQPIIEKLSPSGGAMGDSISVIGKNFGEDIKNIEVHFIKYENVSADEYYFEERELSSTYPIFLSDKKDNGLQELKFVIPLYVLSGDEYESKLNSSWLTLGRKIRIKVFVNKSPTELKTVTILPNNWKVKVILISLIVTAFFMLVIVALSKEWLFIKSIVYDVRTNAYSLPFFQAFLWTIVFFASYFYLGVCKGLVLNDGLMPDFNPSLIALMGISYGGLLTSSYLTRGSKESSNQTSSHRIPSFKDLIFGNDGTIELPKLQLLGFTLLAIILYIYTLWQGGSLDQLPDIPPTIHTLLITSQGGYLGSKMIGNKINIEYLYPEIINSNEETSLTIIGKGLSDGVKVIIPGLRPLQSQLTDSNTIECVIPANNLRGFKSIILNPPNESSIEFPNILEFKENQTTTQEEAKSKVSASTKPESKSKRKSL